MSIVSKTNVRYITGSSSRKDGAVIAIKFRVFAETEAILKAVTGLLKIKETGISGKLVGNKFSGWDLKLNRFYVEYVTKNRAEFQNAFKTAKRSAINASIVAAEIAEKVKPETKPKK